MNVSAQYGLCGHDTKQLRVSYSGCRRRKEGKDVLFNDALNTFYLRLYDVRHMVNRERGLPLPPLNGIPFFMQCNQTG